MQGLIYKNSIFESNANLESNSINNAVIIDMKIFLTYFVLYIYIYHSMISKTIALELRGKRRSWYITRGSTACSAIFAQVGCSVSYIKGNFISKLVDECSLTGAFHSGSTVPGCQQKPLTYLGDSD